MKVDLENSVSLSSSLKERPGYFPRYYVATISTAESTRTLQKTFEYMIKLLQGKRTILLSIKSTFSYPNFVFKLILATGTILGFVSGKLKAELSMFIFYIYNILLFCS